jgi:hypothetical protein
MFVSAFTCFVGLARLGALSSACLGAPWHPLPTKVQIGPLRPVSREGVAKSSENFPKRSTEQSLRFMRLVHFASMRKARPFFGAPNPSR